MPNNGTQMDNDVINLAKAIRQTESGGNFNAKGASGESGAYQWIPSTWKAHAKQALGDENAPMTPSNQNAVAYTIMKADKDSGLNPAQIAAKWNSGSSTGWENKVGVNEHGVKYDVPRYVKSVTDAYQTIKGGGQVQMDANNPSSLAGTQQGPVPVQGEENLAQKLNKRAEQFGNAGKEDGYLGQSIWGRVGAVAGGINDVVDTVISPVLNKAVDVISDSSLVQKVAGSKPVSNTLDSANSAFQGMGESFAKFEKEHPNAGQFLRDTGNIASLVPIAKGAQVTAKVGVEATKMGLRPIAAKVGQSSEDIMNRVARLDPSDARKFGEKYGETHGNYLQRTGNFGTPEQIIEKEAQKFTQSIQDVDNALASLDGKFKNVHVQAALKDLMAREERIGVASADTAKIARYLDKEASVGLDMSEINDVKRLYERNVKLDYQKQNLPESLERAKRIDDSLREWQFSEAEKLGLKNLPDLNRQTQMSRFVIDKLGKKVTGGTGNNAISLTDWIVISGLDPASITTYFLKKGLGGAGAQARVAKFLAKKPQVAIKPQYGGKTGLPALIKGRDYTPTKEKPRARAMPQSVRETNLGLDEVRKAKIRSAALEQKLLSERASAIRLPSQTRRKGKEGQR